MSMGWVIAIIVLVLAIIVGNPLLLKKSANMDMKRSAENTPAKDKDKDKDKDKEKDKEKEKAPQADKE